MSEVEFPLCIPVHPRAPVVKISFAERNKPAFEIRAATPKPPVVPFVPSALPLATANSFPRGQ